MAHIASTRPGWRSGCLTSFGSTHFDGFADYIYVALQFPDDPVIPVAESADTSTTTTLQYRINTCRPPIYQGASEARIYMQGFGYLVAAYAVVWVGLFVYLAVIMLRIRGVRTELAAVEELVREQQEKHNE